ncbi:MAG TPA: FAD-binding protein [Candidatus Limnocylindrales bacterium]|nr:FAD-binding protein [Candidatus Limnocylindrales bacterium]
MRNWAGNITWRARATHRPASIEELQELVAGSDRVRAVGTGHSFSPIADTPGDLVWTDGLPIVLTVEDSRVTVSAAMSLGRLAEALHSFALAVPNLPSLPHISIGGACATGTHGSGTGNLASFVRSMQVVSHDGSIVTLGPEAAVHLGRLGIVTTLTLDLVPAFELRQYIYEDLPFAAAPQALGSAYSVSLFTDWKRITQVWRKSLGDDNWPGARPADGPRHPIAGMPADNCTEQLGVPGPWHERLPHFRLTHTPSSGDELQSEYFVDFKDASAAIDALTHLDLERALQISELRTVKRDAIWLSPAFGRDSLAIHFTWVSDYGVVRPAIEAVERALAPFDPRPHPGKLSLRPARRSEEFEALAARFDRTGKFS